VNKNLGIIDSEKAPLLAAGDATRKSNADIEALQKRNVEALSPWLLDERNVTNAEYQIGKGMQSDLFVKRLRKLNPSLEFFVYPLNRTKQACAIKEQDGNYRFIIALENGFTPERSIMEKRVELIDDFSVGTPGNPVVERADVMAQAHWVPANNAFGGSWAFEDKTKGLGWKAVEIPGKEITRGWRTVLLRLIEGGYLTVTAVEKEFGADNTPAWQGHTGKALVTTPW
jgi:hypothetical protein